MSQEPSPLPEAQVLPAKRQIRFLAMATAVVLVVVIIVLSVRALFAPHSSPEAPTPAGVVQLTPDQSATLKSQIATYDQQGASVLASGTIAVDETRSTPVFLPYAGQISQVFVEAGAKVQSGTPLLRVRTNDIVDARNTLFGAKAQHAAATAQLRLAEANATRQEETYRTAGGALKDYQQARTDLASAQSALQSADSALGAARDKLAVFGKTPREIGNLEAASGIAGLHADTVLRAPRSGVVATRAVSPGQFVTSGGDKPAFVIADLSRVWLVAQLAESDARRVGLGDRVDVTTPAWPGRVFAATIDNVATSLDPLTHRLSVRASIGNPDGALKPQMFASFAIKPPAGAKAVLTVPAAAVIHEGDTARVWILRDHGLAKARVVRTGDSHDGNVVILAGLKPGERVITAGAIFVNEAGLGE